LAIDDLYERIKEQNTLRVLNTNKMDMEKEDMALRSSSLKEWISKLQNLQFRILDLEDIVQFETKRDVRKERPKQ
jgi:hypothetical protein